MLNIFLIKSKKNATLGLDATNLDLAATLGKGTVGSRRYSKKVNNR